MNIAILGYGKEGKAVEKYFNKKDAEVAVFDNFNKSSLKNINLAGYDMVFRSPSVYPYQKSWTSSTKYFFDNCICPIIGVTGTKGKGTTSTIITEILKSLDKTVHLVGNIGTPAIEILDNIQPDDVVVYEMSSFQLWDLEVSPQISVILRVEPDHLNIHDGMEDYILAKSHICSYQQKSDTCIYFKDNQNSSRIAKLSQGTTIPYPILDKSNLLKDLLDNLSLVGNHNKENCEAALLACSSYFGQNIEDFIEKNFDKLKNCLSHLKGLPHRMEYLRTVDNIKIYDDNFSTTLSSLDVALKTFIDQNFVLIIGGRDKTDYEDVPQIKSLLDNSKTLKSIILIGELGQKLEETYIDKRFIKAKSLEDAVNKALKSAKKQNCTALLMSPTAASFDMFENVYDRGAKFQAIIKSL